MDQDTKTWAMILHFSLLAGWVVPLAGLIAPIIIWQIKKEELPGIDEHGKTALNFILSMLLYGLIASLLVMVVVGIVLVPLLVIVGIVYPIMGGIKANEGELWSYPGIIRFVS